MLSFIIHILAEFQKPYISAHGFATQDHACTNVPGCSRFLFPGGFGKCLLHHRMTESPENECRSIDYLGSTTGVGTEMQHSWQKIWPVCFSCPFVHYICFFFSAVFLFSSKLYMVASLLSTPKLATCQKKSNTFLAVFMFMASLCKILSVDSEVLH